MSRRSVYLTFLSYFYENVLHKSFVRRETAVVDHLSTIQNVVKDLSMEVSNEDSTTI